MRHKFSFIIVLWWVMLCGFLGGMLVWLAPKDERISQDENRNLAGAPEFSWQTVIDGSFMKGVEEYLSDGFFKRDKMIETASDIKTVFDIRSTEESLDVDMEHAVNDFVAEEGSETAEFGEAENIDSADNAFQEQTNPADDAAISADPSHKEYTFWLNLSSGNTRIVYEYPLEHLDRSIAALNAYREVLQEDGEVHFFQIPYGYLGNMLIYEPDRYTGWGCDAEDYMQENAAEGVYIHNGPEILEPYLTKGEMLYYRTDYHWSALGAYYGHAGIRKDQQLPYIEYDDYDYKVYERFLGSLYRENKTAEVRAMADRLEVMYTMFPTQSYKLENLTEKSDAPLMYYNLSSYLAFVGGTVGPWRQFITGGDTGRNALIITDSFGNAFAPYMFPYYDEVHMVDLRPAYYNEYISGGSVKEYIEQYGIDDVYVMLSTSSSMNSPYMLNYLLKYLDY